MHAEMFIVFIVSMVIAQICLMIWRRKHVRSYQVYFLKIFKKNFSSQIATLLGLWLIPLIICLQKFWWRFLLSWVLFTSASWYIWWRVNQNVIMGSTPRFVGFFLRIGISGVGEKRMGFGLKFQNFFFRLWFSGMKI